MKLNKDYAYIIDNETKLNMFLNLAFQDDWIKDEWTSYLKDIYFKRTLTFSNYDLGLICFKYNENAYEFNFDILDLKSAIKKGYQLSKFTITVDEYIDEIFEKCFNKKKDGIT